MPYGSKDVKKGRVVKRGGKRSVLF